MMNIRPTVRPIPYYTVSGSLDDTRLAQALRTEFVPKVRRRLPGNHLGAFRQDTIINFVKRHKKRYPYFLRTDISKFYPSIRHQDLIVGLQIAYRDLLGLSYVPREFKRKYVGAVNQWCKSLPLSRGIPLGSPLSAILAPLMLVPIWLQLKSRFHVPFMVYMDDILIFCEDELQCSEIYASLHIDKTVSGQFSRHQVDFCGWRFSGGYTGISEKKVVGFKERFKQEMKSCKGIDSVAFLKRINRKIDGFGNYYKHGDVAKEFSLLDTFIRSETRKWFAKEHKPCSRSNEGMYQMGLHSLSLCYDKAHREVKRKQVVPRSYFPVTRKEHRESPDFAVLVEQMAKIVSQLSQIVAFQRKQLRLIQDICI